MIADIDLATRIEGAEASMIGEAARGVAARRPEASMWTYSIAGGVASVMAARSPLNKVVGLGFGGVPSSEDLGRIEAAFDERGAPVQVELSSLADPEVARLLTRRGYELIAFEDVLGRQLADHLSAPLPTGIEVRESDEASFDVWLDVVVTGFGHPDEDGIPAHESFGRDVLEAVIRDMAASAGLTRLLAFRDGVPAGGASLRLDGGVAQLTGAATLPEHRRRGVQTALQQDRLDRARRATCDVAVVTTAPGSKSQANARRRGFSMLYTRAVLVRERAASEHTG